LSEPGRQANFVSIIILQCKAIRASRIRDRLMDYRDDIMHAGKRDL